MEDSPIVDLGIRVASRFASANYKVEAFAGLGRHGGALIISEEESPGQKARKMVIKYSYGRLSLDPNSDADADLRNEYKCLMKLRGAEHIVQLIPLADCSINIPGASNGAGSSPSSGLTSDLGRLLTIGSGSGSGPGQSPDSGSGASGSESEDFEARQCPTFAVEYLQWGTLSHFRHRLLEAGVERLPSRFLWRIWLCMVRQCVAMAFPPNHPEDAENIQIQREVIPPGNPQYTSLTQNSGHHENFVFGETIDLLAGEHEPGLPILKLIDFGRGKDVDEETCREFLPNSPHELGSRINLFSAARVSLPFLGDRPPSRGLIQALVQLCCLTARSDEVMEVDESYMYRWRDFRDGKEYSVMTMAPPVFSSNGYVDTQLRTLIVRIMVNGLADILPLKDVLQETEQAVWEKGPNHPRLKTAMATLANISETDETIRQLVQDHIFDPPRRNEA
ncbi:hypothetical protein O1611_g4971 [Lasiodiplodia mahajangana]|uniref:Uncharacterized protein n=1 Tax=Lasiodiplodia mahajangana TaxID=1108764 RepID=A0ACC2JMU3_9PEZI|nr:hypothetical protein O1611_g4971 [Lasiodiplodia mahajangana]